MCRGVLESLGGEVVGFGISDGAIVFILDLTDHTVAVDSGLQVELDLEFSVDDGLRIVVRDWGVGKDFGHSVMVLLSFLRRESRATVYGISNVATEVVFHRLLEMGAQKSGMSEIEGAGNFSGIVGLKCVLDTDQFLCWGTFFVVGSGTEGREVEGKEIVFKEGDGDIVPAVLFGSVVVAVSVLDSGRKALVVCGHSDCWVVVFVRATVGIERIGFVFGVGVVAVGFCFYGSGALWSAGLYFRNYTSVVWYSRDQGTS